MAILYRLPLYVWFNFGEDEDFIDPQIARWSGSQPVPQIGGVVQYKILRGIIERAVVVGYVSESRWLGVVVEPEPGRRVVIFGTELI